MLLHEENFSCNLSHNVVVTQVARKSSNIPTLELYMPSNIFVTAASIAQSKITIELLQWKCWETCSIQGCYTRQSHITCVATAQQNGKTSCKKNYPGSFIRLKKKLGIGHSLFLTFLRSLGGSFRALIISDEALGTTDTFACLFWIVNWTVMRSPFQSCVALAMSSPTFLGDWNVYNKQDYK